MSKLTGIKKVNTPLLIKALIIATLPVLSCVLYCLLSGGSLFNVYLPASEWNDEVYYYKQIEGMIAYGFPRGFFGYNEEHALMLSFASWSPALYLPWALWGFCFGWNVYSPVIANIVFLSLTLAVYVILTNPKVNQLVAFSVLFILFRPITRYAMSLVPETICHCMAILITALGISYQRKEKSVKLIFIFALASYAMLMRPYMVLFMGLPVFFLIKKRKAVGAIVSAVIVAVTSVGYYLINHYLLSPYLEPVFSIEWLRAFQNGGLVYGIKGILSLLGNATKEYIYWIRVFFSEGRAQGSYFIVFSGLTVILIWQLVTGLVNVIRNKRDGRPKEEELKHLPVLAGITISFILMLFALLLMYSLEDGARHLQIFILASFVVLSAYLERDYSKVIISALLILAVFIRPIADYESAVPFKTDEAVNKEAFWTESFSSMELNKKDAPSFDNTVMWVINDVNDTDGFASDWRILYYLPKGFGISGVQGTYAYDNFDSIKCRYIMAPKGGRVDELCRGSNYKVIGEDAKTVVYNRKNVE